MERQSIGTSLRWLLLCLLRPYLRNRFIDRGKWFLMHRLNPKPGRDLACERYGTRVCRMQGGGLVNCEMKHAADRFVYFTGEYEISLTRFIRRVIGPGWRFVDIGANVGKCTVIAAGLADEVISAEPNPVSHERLKANVELNGFDNVRLLTVALGEEESEAELFQEDENLGGTSLLNTSDTAVAKKVRVVPGDSIVSPTTELRTYLKIDVEGFEEHALHGFRKLLEVGNMVVQVEMTDEWLRKAGGSADSLFAFMRERGYYAYEGVTRSCIKTRVELEAMDRPLDEFQYDVIFLPFSSASQFWNWVNER